MNKAIFWDRDGVINEVIFRNGKPCSPRKFEEFKIKPNVKEVLEKVKKMGYLNIITTNQPDIARKLMDPEELEKMHEFIKKNLSIDDIFVCPHDNKNNCMCRKPKPGMLYLASQKYNINLPSSFMVGDTWKDVEAGKKAGCKTILLITFYNYGINADFKVKDIREIVKIIQIARR